MSQPVVWRRGKLRPALPLRIRMRLRARHQIDTAAIWLVDHEHTDAAARLWRMAGMWRKR